MKKFFGMLAIAVALVACNDESASNATEDSIRTADSLRRIEDSLATLPPVAPVDSLGVLTPDSVK